MDHELRIESALRDDGIELSVLGRTYRIGYPSEVWQATPASIRQALQENLAFACTHFLGPMLKCSQLTYNTPAPLLHSFLFHNQLYDLLSCEMADGARHLSYLRLLYNLEYRFAPGASTLPASPPRVTPLRPTAIIPFTFGKESLVTYAMARELGIEPVLVYCQEPVQPYEEQYKLRVLEQLRRDHGVHVYFIRNDPGLFRYGQAFAGRRGVRPGTEIGWGAQTTLLALMMLPFVFVHGAEQILFGNECSNNQYLMRRGWKAHLSYDQSSAWTVQQSNMVRILTCDTCRVASSLEPLEELAIFHLLHTRYSELGRYQFSCSAEKPLVPGTQWCHACHKCERMFVFARCCGIDPASFGLRRDLLDEPGHFASFLGTEFKSGSQAELEGVFTALTLNGVGGRYVEAFRERRLPQLTPWPAYRDLFLQLKGGDNLPPRFRSALADIFEDNKQRLGRALPSADARPPRVGS